MHFGGQRNSIRASFKIRTLIGPKIEISWVNLCRESNCWIGRVTGLQYLHEQRLGHVQDQAQIFQPLSWRQGWFLEVQDPPAYFQSWHCSMNTGLQDWNRMLLSSRSSKYPTMKHPGFAGDPWPEPTLCWTTWKWIAQHSRAANTVSILQKNLWWGWKISICR